MKISKYNNLHQLGLFILNCYPNIVNAIVLAIILKAYSNKNANRAVKLKAAVVLDNETPRIKRPIVAKCQLYGINGPPLVQKEE